MYMVWTFKLYSCPSTGNTQLLVPHLDSPARMARVSSGYIRQMTEERLLIPGRNLTLMDTVGQGTGNPANSNSVKRNLCLQENPQPFILYIVGMDKSNPLLA